MVSLAIFSFHLCFSFGPVAQVSVQAVRKDGGSSNSTAVLRDQAPHNATPVASPQFAVLGSRSFFASGAKFLIRKALPEQNTRSPCARSPGLGAALGSLVPAPSSSLPYPSGCLLAAINLGLLTPIIQGLWSIADLCGN